MPDITITVSVDTTKLEELKAKLLATALEYDADAIIDIEEDDENDEEE